MDLINKFKRLLTEAHGLINEEDAAKEAKKINTFRVGSSGAIVDGAVYSTQCGRLAQARYLGFQSPPTEEMRVMFNGGFTLEDYITKRFTTLGLKFVAEKEHNVEVVPGITISGRPDFELTIDGQEIGIEIKSLASHFSVIKRYKNRFPFMKHMIQSATYMTMLNRDSWLIAIGHSFHVRDGAKQYPPAVEWFEMKWEGGKFTVYNEKDQKATLPFDKSHIIAYYQEQKSANEDKRLMARPKEEELNVDTYNRCNYCPMKQACLEYDLGKVTFENWLARVLVSKEKDQRNAKV